MAKTQHNPQDLRRAKLAWRVFIVVLVAMLGLEFAMHPHAVFGIEGTPFFHAWYVFLACAAIVVVSKALGMVLKRPDNYYEDEQ